MLPLSGHNSTGGAAGSQGQAWRAAPGFVNNYKPGLKGVKNLATLNIADVKTVAIEFDERSLVMLAPFQGEQSPLVSDPGTSAERAALDHLSKK